MRCACGGFRIVHSLLVFKYLNVLFVRDFEETLHLFMSMGHPFANISKVIGNPRQIFYRGPFKCYAQLFLLFLIFKFYFGSWVCTGRNIFFSNWIYITFVACYIKETLLLEMMAPCQSCESPFLLAPCSESTAPF
jgi:hypothetical protein